MNTLVVDGKKHVIMEKREYDKLLEKAASKKLTARKLNLAEGKKLAYSLIETWQKSHQ